MADPIAVSSWKTGVEDESLGLTVFLFLMSGRGSVPFDCIRVSFRRSKLTQRLLVLKNLCLRDRRSGDFCTQHDAILLLHEGLQGHALLQMKIGWIAFQNQQQGRVAAVQTSPLKLHHDPTTGVIEEVTLSAHDCWLI